MGSAENAGVAVADDEGEHADSAPVNRRQQILDVAERLARTGGYNGFSFRDIAAEVGVKSASVHYHFPTKGDLAVALISRFRLKTLDALGPAEEPGSMLRLIGVFREALADGQGICLAGHLGAGCQPLPDPVRAELTLFFCDLIEWSATCLGETGDDRSGAEAVIAGLEGAMMVSINMEDPGVFDRAATRLLDAAKGQPWRSSKR